MTKFSDQNAKTRKLLEELSSLEKQYISAIKINPKDINRTREHLAAIDKMVSRMKTIHNTEKQSKCLAFIVKFQREFGFSPSYTEIMLALGNNSTSSVYHMLKRLEERGFIKVVPWYSRSIEVFKPGIMQVVS